MTSVFGKKIFRLLLAFALVPSILLTITGYYLTTETAGMLSASTDDHFLELSDYVGRRTTALVVADIDALAKDTSASTSVVDFALLGAGHGLVRLIDDDSVLTFEVINRLNRAAVRKQDGYVEVDTLTLQYSFRRFDDSLALIGGVIHDEEYTALLASHRADRVERLSARRLLDSYLGFLAVLLGVLVLIAAGLAYYLSRRVSGHLSRPVTQLAQAAQAIAGGDFKQQVTAQASGELKTLIESFNHMAAQLETTTAQLAQSERVAAWQHVARRFAHELKNPLQPILVSLYQIENTLSANEVFDPVRKPLRAISDDVRHLTKLAERFSDLAKLPPPKIEDIDLVELLQSVAELYREQLQEYDFRLDIPDTPVRAELDPTYFREALHNLLKNAVEATPIDGRILLGLTDKENRIEIVVRDFGHGMAEEVQGAARIPYFTTKSTGSGLGLAIVERTVSELSGRLDITSVPHEGTTVTITVPKIYREPHA